MAYFSADFPPTLGSEVAAGQHYMMIDSYESNNATASGALGAHLSSIGLYIPTGSLKTSFTGNYEGKEGAALKAATGDTGRNAFESLKNLKFTQASAADATKSFGDLFDVGGSAVQGIAAQLADKSGFISASGNTPNNYMALVYGGPNEFRQHSFGFKFFPRNNSESNTVKDIIEEFKRGTLPRMSRGTGTGKNLLDPFFKSPRQHTIKFMKGGVTTAGNQNPYLFKIGKSVITAMDINYDPQTTVSFHNDGSPVSIDLSLTFKEIAFQISGDNANARDLDLSGAVRQNQAAAAQRDANLASLGGQSADGSFNPRLG